LPTLDAAALEALIGRSIAISGHFVDPVTLDGVEDLGDAVSLAPGDINRNLAHRLATPKLQRSRGT
jgi:hypothetical protein